MACLAACGKEETATSGPISTDQAKQIGTTIVEQMNAIVTQDAMEDVVVNPAIYSGLQGWESALNDIGEYKSVDGVSVASNEDEVIITVNVLGSSHNAEVEIIFDSTLSNIMGVTTNVQYSMGEILLKAFMNTLIGMGTVFVVLILISLIISCFSLVSKIEAKKKKEEPAAAASDPVVEQIAAKEELSDDTELVAVIAAAVAAYEGAAGTDGFVVRSIRKSNKSKWQNA